jgi:amino acid adenylation domain-containing protein
MDVLKEWNGVAMAFPRERTVLDFFQAQVQARPEAVAVKEDQRLMTFAELDLLSNRVANELQRQGLQLEEAVALLLPASCEFLVAILGILKAGGSYFPIDMETPAKRREFLLTDSRSRFVLADTTGLERLREWSGMALDVAQIIGHSGAGVDNNPGVPSDPNRRAYITYTSGSTGQPKGVEIEHHSLTNLVCYYHQRLQLAGQDRVAMLAYVAFDASVADIWPTLCAGGFVTIPPKGLLLNPDRLITWLATEEVTLTFVPTGLAEILFARKWPEQMKLRFLITGGDRLRFRPPAGLSFPVVNGYGPTENTVFSTWSVVTPDNGSGQPPPIGRPIGNVRTYVLDEHRQPVPVGEEGELYLGGEQVARGYLERFELTRERFLPDPFAGEPEARMYRTGDWVRWLADGELDFLGRKDGQVQIRGRRVELGEIEAMVFAHGSVQQACCVPRLDDGMPAGIVAHIVLRDSSSNSSDDLRAYLNARLPDYMVPSEFVVHESLPLTPQGKLDRAALAARQPVKSEPVQPVAGDDKLDQALALLWQSMLPSAKNSQRDVSFSTLGGDSLLAIKLMLGVEEITGKRLELSTFLLKPTFAGLCEAVRTRLSSKFQPVLALRKEGVRPPLFFLYAVDGDIGIYFELAQALGNDQPVFGIRSPALEDLSCLPDSIEDAAAEVVRWIRQIQPDGAPALVGYSWGGLLAFEVARQLAQTDGIFCFTALIGTGSPLRPTNFASRLAHFAVNFPHWLRNLLTDRGNRWRRLSRWQDMARVAKRNLAETNALMPDWESPISRHLIGLMEKYHPLPKYKMAVDLFREYDAYQPPGHPLHIWRTSHLPDSGWNRWTCRPNRIHWVEGDHATIVKPPMVSGLAQSIRQAMDKHIQCGLPGPESHANQR